MENCQNKAAWALSIRKNQPQEEQARIFYETYRISLSKEEEFKQTIEKLRRDCDSKDKKINILNMDYASVKNKLQKFKNALQYEITDKPFASKVPKASECNT